MNTVKSFWVGWGSLIIAGGGAYYFAKRSINADRAERHAEDLRRRRVAQSLEGRPAATPTSHPRADVAGSPSQEASHDPAPTRHAPENEHQRVREKSKYEASQPFRSTKGDRFS